MAGTNWGQMIRGGIERMARTRVQGIGRRSTSSSSGVGMPSGFRTNAPRLVTIALALALTVAGLVVTDTISIAFVQDLLAKTGIHFTENIGYLALAASPVILVLGSFLTGF